MGQLSSPSKRDRARRPKTALDAGRIAPDVQDLERRDLTGAWARIGRAEFMTLPMWFTWLLRGDIRGDSPIPDERGQREFISWWLLYGALDYPKVWSYGPDHATIAMEPADTIEGLALPRLLLYIWLRRPDLRRQFPLRDEEDLADLLSWYRACGPRQYEGAVELPFNALNATVAASRRPPWDEGTAVPRLAAMLWRVTPDLQRLFPSDVPAARSALANWFTAYGGSRLPAFRLPMREASAAGMETSCSRDRSESLGVNLVGFVHAEFGLGEDVRMTSLALEEAGVQHVIVDAKTPRGVRGADGPRKASISGSLIYPITIFCMSAFDTAQLYLDRGPSFLEGRYNIGYWPWELPTFPACWAPLIELFSEIWASTRFQEQAYLRTSRRPVLLMKPAIAVPKIRKVSTKKLFSFIYPFDPRSYLSRKNPIAVVRAFRRAFPRSDHSVKLILRANGSPATAKGWRAVVRAATGDRRIQILSGTLAKRDALALLQASDCLVSPHRAEGFGRNVAEAIALEVPVLATGFSGTSDYLERGERIPATQRSLNEGDYPFHEGQSWGEPKISALAAMMLARRSHPANRLEAKHRAERLMTVYAAAVAGDRFRRRLEDVWSKLPVASLDLYAPVQKRARKRNKKAAQNAR